MKTDLDRLMEERNLDGLWVTGQAGINPALSYFVGKVHLTHADILKKRGEAAVLYHGAMERDEAAATGLQTELITGDSVIKNLEIANGDEFKATALRLSQAFSQQGMSGRIAVLGNSEIGRILSIIRNLEEMMPACDFINDSGADGALRQARLTKDDGELELMREIGMVTVDVVGQIADYLINRTVENEVLLDEGGQPLTVGKIKRKIHLLLAERGAESPSGPIFAPGREGAIGHSTGLPDQIISLGVPIVFDIYPRSINGGYYFDFTRTWCLGYAPDEVVALHQQVLEVYQVLRQRMVAGAKPMDLQIETCERFEAMGHPTLMTNANTQSGYFHSLAHGLGLEIHEPPIFRHYENPNNLTLAPRMVLTHEPGLYYPERAMGVRLEDALVIQAEGPPEPLADYPHDLVLPMKST